VQSRSAQAQSESVATGEATTEEEEKISDSTARPRVVKSAAMRAMIVSSAFLLATATPPCARAEDGDEARAFVIEVVS